ncbi:MAG: hypothetical protein WB677_20745 [Xanthobacteraceae bacterium]
MDDLLDDLLMTNAKRSSKLLIFDSRQYLYCVYRAPGPWTNANSLSFVGVDGDTIDGVLRQVREKFRLGTEANDWSVLGTVPNPADNEINTIWKFARPIDSLLFSPAAYGGLLCVKPSALQLFDKMLSPALLSVMRAMPHLFEDR